MQAPLRILTVDDESSITLSLRFVFSDPHYELTCVDSGKAALAKLNSNSELYDVIIVDEKMPNMTGVELVGLIRQREIKGKIVVVSAHLNTAIRQAYKRLGVQLLFSKPFNVEELRNAIDRIAA